MDEKESQPKFEGSIEETKKSEQTPEKPEQKIESQEYLDKLSHDLSQETESLTQESIDSGNTRIESAVKSTSGDAKDVEAGKAKLFDVQKFMKGVARGAQDTIRAIAKFGVGVDLSKKPKGKPIESEKPSLLTELNEKESSLRENLDSDRIESEKIEEYKEKFAKFKSFYEGLNEEFQKELVFQGNGNEARKLISIFLGLKPATTDDSIFYARILEQNPREFGYQANINDNMGGYQDVFYNKKSVIEMIDKYPALFPEYQKVKNNSTKEIDKNINEQVNKLPTWQWSKDRNDSHRAGLLLGYPEKAVFGFNVNSKSNLNREGYLSYGFSFKFDKNNKDERDTISEFDDKLQKIFELSGATAFINSERDQFKNNSKI